MTIEGGSLHPKILEYVERIEKGEPKENIFQGLPPGMRGNVEIGLERAREARVAADQIEIEKLRQALHSSPLENIQNAPERISDMEILKSKIEALAKDYYFLTHQTPADIAEDINVKGFNFQAGGLNTTMLYQGPESLMISLQKMTEGESHRNYDGMFVIAVPRQEVSEYLNGRRFSPDEFADYLMDEHLDELGDKLTIPTRYNLGTFDKQKGFSFN